MTRRARRASVAVGGQPARPLARDQRRRAVARTGANGLERLGDPPRHELVVASGVWPLVQMHRPLTGLASVAPCLLARQ